MKKYIVYGGYVLSRYDNEQHYVNAYRVSRLYNVPPSECIFIETKGNYQKDILGLDTSHYKELFPRSDGEYKNN